MRRDCGGLRRVGNFRDGVDGSGPMRSWYLRTGRRISLVHVENGWGVTRCGSIRAWVVDVRGMIVVTQESFVIAVVQVGHGEGEIGKKRMGMNG